MADRTNYFYRQRVTEAELDLGFELLEKADRNLAADIGIYGIISGAVPAAHQPVNDLSIDLTAPAKAYDNSGRRIFFGTGQTVDCSVDLDGNSTAVPTPGEERWLGVFIRFDRLLSDPRTDGNSNEIFFRQDESFEIVVRQGTAAAANSAQRVALVANELLICDVRIQNGQTQIAAGNISTTRRQAFVFATGDAVSIVSGTWTELAPVTNTVQSAFNSVDNVLKAKLPSAGGTLTGPVNLNSDISFIKQLAANTWKQILQLGPANVGMQVQIDDTNRPVIRLTGGDSSAKGALEARTIALSDMELLFALHLGNVYGRLLYDAANVRFHFKNGEGDSAPVLAFAYRADQFEMSGARPGRGYMPAETMPYAFASVVAGTPPTLAKSFNLDSTAPITRIDVGQYKIKTNTALSEGGMFVTSATVRNAAGYACVNTGINPLQEIVVFTYDNTGTLADCDFDLVAWAWD